MPARRCWRTWPVGRALPMRRPPSNGTPPPGAPTPYAAALERFLALGGADLEPRARATCAELGLSVSLDQETATLSGGEAARAGLAAILLSRFDVLLLDEPTNDLDFDGLDRLERFVDRFAGGIAVVSHDRVFLDRTATRIAEIDPWTGRVQEHAGGWSEYAAARELARQRQYAAFADAQERRSEVEALLHARRNQARAGGAFLAHATGGSDRRGTQGARGKGAPGGAGAGADRARREAVRALAAAPLACRRTTAGRPRRLARRCRGRAGRVHGSAQSISTWPPASASR